MNIKINDYIFSDAVWEVNNGIGIMRIATEESIVSIIGHIGEKNNVEVYDDEQTLTSVWYNSGILNANEYRNENEPRKVEISFAVSILSSNAEENLQAGIDESVDGIFELAEYINEIETEHTETRRRIDMYTQSVQDVAKNFDNKQADTNDKFEVKDRQIQDLVGAVNSLQDGLTAVQASIDDIPKDIVDRFEALWNKYNALADRVARLENKEA